MHDTLNAAREQARQWREAHGATGGLVLVLGGEFVGWLPELPPATQWVAGCLAIGEDGHAHYIREDWRRPLEWTDLGPPTVEAAPPPSPPEPDSQPLHKPS